VGKASKSLAVALGGPTEERERFESGSSSKVSSARRLWEDKGEGSRQMGEEMLEISSDVHAAPVGRVMTQVGVGEVEAAVVVKLRRGL
jgi:hypothetical protein